MAVKKKVLFVCVENSCRSQMAEAFARMYRPAQDEIYSAGSRPSRRVNPRAVEAMRELGCDMSGQASKSLAEIPDVKYDIVVTMGCGDACPSVRADRREDWTIPDPASMAPEEFRKVRDLICEKVRALLDELSTPCEVGKTVMIVGNPNVGKSVLFNALSKQYAAVSNYPGTTVEVTRGVARIDEVDHDIVDTPGMYSIMPVTEEERVARRMLMQERPRVVLHVIDAKNLERMLTLTIQLLEAGLPVILVLNVMDEAEQEGVSIDVARLSQELGISVIAAVSTEGRGLPEIRDAIRTCRQPRDAGSVRANLGETVEKAARSIAALLPADYSAHVSRRSVALLLLAEDAEIEGQLRDRMGSGYDGIGAIVRETSGRLNHPMSYHIALQQRAEANRLAGLVVSQGDRPVGLRERLSRLTMNPITGIPILLAVLYFGLYKFVGGFGAGTVVDFLEDAVFQQRVSPFLVRFFGQFVPWHAVQDLLVGEYGILTLGLRYAFSIILPIVTFFFLFFAVIEDSGYLPRLAMLIDRVFKKIGLSGRAVIPMVLGLGCDTMATMVTRTLPTKRERVIATLLLALAVPCSAQLGVILALLEGRPLVMAVWTAVVWLVFLAVGFLSARIMPGSPPSFYMEIPPLRLPQLSNVLIKTYARVKWYLKEIVPIFLAASFLIWLGQMVGLFDLLVRLLAAPVRALGLPPQCAEVFLFGFFRRDYGAAGLYDLNKQHLLNNAQIAVACVALTLFLPCIAQFLVNLKERGWRAGIAISAVTLVVSFGVAYVLNFLLTISGATL